MIRTLTALVLLVFSLQTRAAAPSGDLQLLTSGTPVSANYYAFTATLTRGLVSTTLVGFLNLTQCLTVSCDTFAVEIVFPAQAGVSAAHGFGKYTLNSTTPISTLVGSVTTSKFVPKAERYTLSINSSWNTYGIYYGDESDAGSAKLNGKKYNSVVTFTGEVSVLSGTRP